MEGRNCPNCGAVIDKDVDKCAYCGTSYFDLTAIDISDGTPIYLKIKVNGIKMTMKCRPRFTGIEETIETNYAFEGEEQSTFVCDSRRIELGIDFEAIPDDKGNLIVMERD